MPPGHLKEKIVAESACATFQVLTTFSHGMPCVDAPDLDGNGEFSAEVLDKLLILLRFFSPQLVVQVGCGQIQ
jgi:hypothetical protein